MVKTRSSARVGSKTGGTGSGAAENGDANALVAAMAENGHRMHSTYMRQSQTGSNIVGGNTTGGKDGNAAPPPNPMTNNALANAMSAAVGLIPGASRGGMYHHPVSAPGSQYVSSQDRNVMQVAPRTFSMYPQNMYHQNQQHQQQQQQMAILDKPTSAAMHLPVHPDVKMRKLPFYDVLGEIMKPSTLVPNSAQRIQEGNFFFHLTPHQASDIATGRDIVGVNNKMENIVQAQLRFCLLETSCEQEDCFPPSVVVKVNNKACPLPNPIPTNKQGVEPKRPPRPVNITSLLKLSPTVSNSITVQWAMDFTKGYAISISLVRKLTSAQLLQRLKNKGTKNADYTRSIIKEKLSEDYDCEIATTCLRVSLVCPLGKMRMQVPCRPQTCSHLQCFDASIFLQMNERKPTWSCPVCDKAATYDSLVVDGYFMEVLSSSRLPFGCGDIQLNKDGSWSAQSPKKAAPLSPSPAHGSTADNNIEIISDDVEVVPIDTGSTSTAKRLAISSNGGSTSAADDKPKPADVVDLTSDSDDDLPLKRKVADSSSQHQDNHQKFSDGGTVTSSGYQSPADMLGVGSGGGRVSPQAIISLDSPSPPRVLSPPSPPAAPSPAPSPLALPPSPPAPPVTTGPSAPSAHAPQMALNPLAVNKTGSSNVNGAMPSASASSSPSPLPAHQASLAVGSGSPGQGWPAPSPAPGAASGMAPDTAPGTASAVPFRAELPLAAFRAEPTSPSSADLSRLETATEVPLVGIETYRY